MKYHLTGFTASAVFHAALAVVVLPLLLWQDLLEKPSEPQPLTLSLTQFQAAPPPPVAQPVVPPEPAPIEPAPPKPVEKPKPKPPEKPIPPKKSVTKPAPKPPPRPEPAPVAVAPTPVAAPEPRPVAVAPEPRPAPIAAPAARPTPAPANNQAAEAAYRAKLQRLIATRKQYPHSAEQAEIEGTVMVSFTILPNGTIMGARVSQSSGHESLDKAALQAVNAASGVLPFPPGIDKARWDFSLKVNFTLE